MGEAKRKALYKQVQELNLKTNNERAAAFSAKWKRSEAAKKAAATRKANRERFLRETAMP